MRAMRAVTMRAFRLGALTGMVIATASGAAAQDTPEDVFQRVREKFEGQKDQPPEVRIETVKEFAGAPCKLTVAYLGRLYRTEENAGILMEATMALGEIGTADAVQAIVTGASAKPGAQGTVFAQDAFASNAIANALGKTLSPEAEAWFLAGGRQTKILRSNPQLWRQILGAIGGFASLQRIPALLDELQTERDPVLQATILGLLEGEKDPKIAKAALRFLRASDPKVQVAALRCLFHQDAAAYRSQFVTELRSPHVEVRLLALQILARTGDRDAITHAKKLLADPDPRMQVTAIRILARNGGKDVVPALIEKMKTAKGRVMDDLADAMARLSGRNFGPAGVQWESWWTQMKEAPGAIKNLTDEELSLLLGATKKDTQTLTYHGLRVLSDNAAFIIDTSESMKLEYVPKDERERLGTEEAAAGGGVASAAAAKAAEASRLESAKRTRMEVAKEELAQVVQGLADGKRFNVIGFDSVTRDLIKDGLGKYDEHLETMGPEVRDRARAFIQSVSPQGQTYMLHALKAALAYPEVDTIYLLSDGAPTAASGNTDEILRYLRQENRLRSVRINTIGFHLEPEEKAFLLQLAGENFGVFIER